MSGRIDFKAIESRGNYREPPSTLPRELALALLAVGIITLSSLAIARSPRLSRVMRHERVPLPVWKVLLTVGVILAFRSCCVRGCLGSILGASVWPMRGYQVAGLVDIASPHRDDWNEMDHHWVEAQDGNRIHAQILEGHAGRTHTGEAILISLGNGYLHEDHNPMEFLPLTDAGYSLVFYHPPGYGQSSGVRTLASDFLAAEALVQWLMKSGRVADEGQLHVVGYSIGSGPMTELMTKYRFGSGVLIVPLARIENVVRRMVGPVEPLVRGMVRERYEYDNLSKMGRLATERVVIYQSLNDELMGRQPGREAELMARAWQESAPGFTEESSANRIRWADGERRLYLMSTDTGHNVHLGRRLEHHFL